MTTEAERTTVVAGSGDSGSDLVSFEDVEFGYGDGPTVITDIDFTIRRGEVITLLGASGCGKSTLLNMVAGLLQPRRGQCLFAGREVRGVNTEVGYMTQDDTLLPWRTVRANIALPLKIRNIGRAEQDERIRTYLRLLNLEHAERRFPAQLSGGMKRRALLARSVIYEPRMVLMDEPFAAIDADLREELHEEVRRMVARLDQTVLFVTHDIGEAALLSDRVVVLAGRPAARIAAIIEMPFGPDRDLTALRSSSEYFDAQVQLREALRAVPRSDGEEPSDAG